MIIEIFNHEHCSNISRLKIINFWQQCENMTFSLNIIHYLFSIYMILRFSQITGRFIAFSIERTGLFKNSFDIYPIFTFFVSNFLKRAIKTSMKSLRSWDSSISYDFIFRMIMGIVRILKSSISLIYFTGKWQWKSRSWDW